MEESVLSKLPRHEPTLERQLYRALHELERRQAARRCPHACPGSAACGLGDARRDGALRFSFVSRFLFTRVSLECVECLSVLKNVLGIQFSEYKNTQTVVRGYAVRIRVA